MRIPLLIISFITLLGCNTNKTKEKTSSIVLERSLFSKYLKDSINYSIYLPEKFENTKNHRILYLMHGHGGSNKDWFNEKEGNIKHILDSLIRTKNIKPTIAVSLNAGNSWYLNSIKPMELIYINEFIPYIETEYDVLVNRKTRMVAGNSAGGFGALNFGLKYPDLFESVILLSPAAYFPSPPEISSSRVIDVFKFNGVFNDSIWKSNSYRNLIDASKSIINYPKFYTSTGDDDAYGISNVIFELKSFFITNQIDCEVSVIKGGHDWAVWNECFTNDLVRIFND
jgi:enterochelin esterase-like enzyme